MRTPMEELSNETIELTKQVFAKGVDLEKAITTATGLVGYNLEAPAKKLYPVLSPLRNRIARTRAPVGSLAANWRAVTGINATNLKAAVAFGARNSEISYSTVNRSAAYKSFGLDDSVQFEAVWLSKGFEDVRAYSALATLQATMIEEEKLILAGLSNDPDFALGTAPTPTLSKATGGGSGWSTNAYVKCVALSLYGWLNSNRSDLTQAPADHSAISATANLAVAATDTVYATVAPVGGAFGYAWYVGTGSSEPSSLKLAAYTSVPSATFTAPPAGGNHGSDTAGMSADTASDANAFCGIIPQILPKSATLTTLLSVSSGTLKKATGGSSYVPNSLVFDMAQANGDGTALTADNAGGIVELDIVLKALWDEARIGPTLILLNSQEALNITKKIGGSSNLSYRIMLSDGQKDVVGGVFVSGYLNKFSSSLTPGNPDVVPFLLHPFLPPGTIVVLSERLPYPNNEVANVLEMEMQSEYADYEWARAQRKYEHGVYAMGVLKHYFPAGCALIRGIKNG